MKLRVIHYSANGDLPEAVRAALPDDVAQTLFRAAFNSHVSDGRTEMHAYIKAYRVLEDAGYLWNSEKKVWIHKDALTVGDVHVNRPLGSDKRKDDPGTQDVAPPNVGVLALPLISKQDKITLDVPLFIRLLETAREEIKEDEPLHVITEKITELLIKKPVLDMSDYEAIVAEIKKYSENQPRDESGKWTAGDGGGDTDKLSPRALPKPDPVPPDKGQFSAIRTDDGSLYWQKDFAGITHVRMARDKGIPAERIVGGGWIINGDYQESERSDSTRYGERGRAALHSGEYLKREGQLEEIAKRISGNSSISLNSKGRVLADKLGQRIALKGGLDVLHSSPLPRAIETADAIAKHNPEMERAEPADALRPWRLGEMEGRESSDVGSLIEHYIEHPEEVPPGKGNDGKPGEPFENAKIRQLDYLLDVYTDSEIHPNMKIGVVMHSRGMELLKSWVDADCPEDYKLDIKDLLKPNDPEHADMLRWHNGKIKEIDVTDDDELKPGVYLILHSLTDDDTDKGNEDLEKAEDHTLTLYLPPIEVNRACKTAQEAGTSINGITEPLSKGEGIAEVEVRKIAAYFATEDTATDTPDIWRNAWGGSRAALWAGRVLKKIERDQVEKAGDDEEGEWVTINGQHVMVNDKGEVIRGNPRVAGTVAILPKLSERAQRALDSRKPCGADKQRIADEQERIISRALGIPRTGDNSAFDLRNDKVGVELKTMVDSRNGKITMSKVAMDRKVGESVRSRIKMFTVVADKRAGGTKYYVSKGVGSFRVRSMTLVTLPTLREMVRGR